MARIRSTHPDQWNDEDFVELSAWARLLCIGIRNFADDKGVFEWKPKRILMRIFPADAVEIDTLLVELVSNNVVEKYEVDGKSYGVIRNFRKYQRPKNPNDIYPLPDRLKKYAGFPYENQQDDGVEFPPNGEFDTQMEEGGGNSKSLSKDKHVDFDDFWNSWPSKVSKGTAQKAWRCLTADEQRLAASMGADWFADWRSRNPRASAIGASRYLSEKRWTDMTETPTKIDQNAKLAFYANLINGDSFIAKGSISETVQRELLDAQLVTPEKLRERGIAA